MVRLTEMENGYYVLEVDHEGLKMKKVLKAADGNASEMKPAPGGLSLEIDTED